MQKSLFIIIVFIPAGLVTACDKETIDIPGEFDELLPNKNFDDEIFSGHDSTIYGTWKIYSISGGFHGGGYEVNFD